MDNLSVGVGVLKKKKKKKERKDRRHVHAALIRAPSKDSLTR